MNAALPAGVLPAKPEMIKVTLEIDPEQKGKLLAFMAGDTWEEAQAARKLDIEECGKSLEVCIDVAFRHMGTSGGRVVATFLASLYNGDRVKADLSDIRRLDMALGQHVLNVMRLRFETNREPHEFIADGGRVFEEMIANWGLEKKRRRS